MTEIQFEECIKAIQDGEKEGLKRIYECYLSFIYSIVYDILKNKEDAEDVTTEFFIKLWKIVDSYQFRGKHKAWLAKIAHNMAIDHIRKRKYHESYEEISPSIEPYHRGFEQNSIDKMTLSEIVQQLEDTEKTIINMKFLGDMTFKEIAKVLKKPLGTVTWKYRQAIEKLRKAGE